MSKAVPAKDMSRNVWLQFGLPDAEEHYLKAELTLRLARTIGAQGLTQRAAARRIGTSQPELSRIMCGKFFEVSFERLLRFLAALGHEIEITVGARRTGRAGGVVVRDSRRRAA
ncbi:MAG TPA: helix-turn-helix transcriptional regulator [Alphaproteobacteria bacterium]